MKAIWSQLVRLVAASTVIALVSPYTTVARDAAEIPASTSAPAAFACKNPPSHLIVLRHGCKVPVKTRAEDEVAPLCSSGEKQAAELVERVAGYKIDAIYVTTRKRSQQTAAPLAKVRHIKPAP